MRSVSTVGAADQADLWMPPPYPLELLFGPWRHHPRYLRHIGITGVYVVGLEVNALLAVSESLANVAANTLMDLKPLPVEFGQRQLLDGFYGSVMPDGSMTGIINTRLLEPEIHVKKFRL